MNYKLNGGIEPLTTCAIGACPSIVGPALTALGIGTAGIALSRKKSKGGGGKKLRRKSRRKSRKKSRRKSKRKQSGGINPANIITTQNKNNYIGRLVKIKEIIPNIETEFLDEYNMRETLWKIERPDLNFVMDQRRVAVTHAQHFGLPVPGWVTNRDHIILSTEDDRYNEAAGYYNTILSIPNNMDEIYNNQFDYLIELVTDTGVSEMLTRDNIRRLNRNARDRRRLRQLALTEARIDTERSRLDLHSTQRVTNPTAFNATITINTMDGPTEVEVPEEIMEIIASYI
jgi:hypothetical protein